MVNGGSAVDVTLLPLMNKSRIPTAATRHSAFATDES
jgi:hypothetical protein